ncbi:MAG: hypothetical protein NW223_09045 [Hyphomicrobiaceae bacterium]|nr:hypothetical protein [Hyphomicrobiaceae bacterium]
MQLASETLNLTPGTIHLISIICALSLVALMAVLPNLLVGVLLYPVSLATALPLMAVLNDLHLIPLKPFAAWLLLSILSAAAGVGAALLTLVAGNRLAGMGVAWRVRALSPPVSIRHVSVHGRGERD